MSFFGPDPTESDHHWDDIICKEKKVEKRRVYNLEQSYGEYVDTQPCFPPSSEVSEIQIPSYIDVADRMSIKSRSMSLRLVGSKPRK